MNFNVELFLIALTAMTGLVALLDHFYLANKREQRQAESEHPEKKIPPNPISDLCISLFPVILIVLILRSFLVEPFRIPSGSMKPTLHVGDFILVNKYTYGLRLPGIHTKVIPLGEPERGDIMVFRYPENPSINYIKRLIGLPGDTIRYQNKKIFINNQPVAQTDPIALIDIHKNEFLSLTENLGTHAHQILHNPKEYGQANEWTVPEGHYFVMGDNRDNSNDSRVWGFVPKENIVGKAFYVWMHWNTQKPGFPIDWSRIGTSIN